MELAIINMYFHPLKVLAIFSLCSVKLLGANDGPSACHPCTPFCYVVPVRVHLPDLLRLRANWGVSEKEGGHG